VLLLTNPSASLDATIKTAPVAKTDLAAIRIVLADDTGSITLVVWPDVFYGLTTQTSPDPGDLVQTRGRVLKSRDEFQITLLAATDLWVLSRAQAIKPGGDTASPYPADKSLTPLANVNDSLTNEDITTQATISEVREPRSERVPFVITLADGNAKVPMVLWMESYERVKQHFRVGNTVRVTVTVSNYRGTLQLRLQTAQDIQSVGAWSPTPPRSDITRPAESNAFPPASVGKVDIARITAESTSRTVTAAGTITTTDSVGMSKRLRVRDATGKSR